MVYYFQLELGVTGPILTKSSLPGDPGLDAVALRDHDGALLLNGKHMEGRAKHAAYDLAELSDGALKAWALQAFGPDNPKTEDERSGWEPMRGSISFEDLRCCTTAAAHRQGARDFRLKMDEARETGEDRMLGVFERAGEHGKLLQFSGLVRIAVTGGTTCETHLSNLLKSLRWITSVGGEAGIGYGVLQSVRLLACKTPAGSEMKFTGPVATSVEIDLKFAAPFCLAAPQLNQNIYEGLDTVPGNAIAGAIMRSLNDVEAGLSKTSYPTLRRCFDRIRFRHAFPARESSPERPTVVPLSWVSVDGTLVDAALTREPALFRLNGRRYAPRFLHDWKTEGIAASEALNLPEVERELRTYTKIDRETGVAEDEKLYSYELVRPEGLTWKSALDLDDVAVDLRPKLIGEVEALLNEAPLLFGKTSARARLTLFNGSSPRLPEPIAADLRNDLWIVLLLTPALLLDARSLVGACREELRAAYEEVWQEYATGSLTLVSYFTAESLVGSNYLFNRFQGRVGSYFPHLITDAGSVFVLSSAPENRVKAQSVLEPLLSGGLPLPKWAVERFKRDGYGGDYWKNCPFLPQNGYGEIAINRREQLDRLPEKSGIVAEAFTTVSV